MVLTKLHLGCGEIKIEGFINIDFRDTDATDLVMDVSDLSEFVDNSVDMIYCAHVLEHFSYKETSNILREWYRVLRPDGELIVRVPDFDILVDRYLGRPTLRFLPADNRFLRIAKYVVKSVLSRLGSCIPFLYPEKRRLTPNFLGDFMGGQTYLGNQHLAIFNEKLITDLLFEAGFSKVTRIPYEYFPMNDASRHYGTMGFSSFKE